MLEEVIKRYGMPSSLNVGDYSGFADELVDIFIEVQLWSDGPVRHLLGAQ